MKLQLDNPEQDSEPVAKVRLEVVDHHLIKVIINDEDVINIWGTRNGKGPYIYVFKHVANELGFGTEVA